MQQLVSRQPVTVHRLTAWLADGALQDPALRAVVEAQAEQLLVKGPAALVHSPNQLAQQLESFQPHAALLNDCPHLSKMLHMCTMLTIKQASSKHTMHMMHSCIVLDIFDGDMRDAVLQRLARLVGDGNRMISIAAVLRILASMSMAGDIDQDVMQLVGSALQEDVPAARASDICAALEGLGKLPSIPSSVDMSAMVDRFVDLRKTWSANLPCQAIVPIAVLHQRQLLELTARQCRRFGVGVNALLERLEPSRMVQLLHGIDVLGPSHAAHMRLSRRGLRAALYSLLPNFSTSNMATVFAGLSTLQLHPVRDLGLDAVKLGDAVNVSLDSVHVTTLRKLLQKCEQLGIDPVEELHIDLSKLAAVLTSAFEDNPSSPVLSQALQALLALNIHPFADVGLDLKRVEATVNEFLEFANPTTVVSLFSVLQRLQLGSRTLNVNVQRVRALVDEGLHTWNDKALIVSLVALSVLRLDLVRDLGVDLPRLGQVVRKTMLEAESGRIGSLLTVLRYMKLHPVKDLGLDAAVLGRSIHAEMQTWQPARLANVLKSLVVLQLDPVEDLGLDRQEWEAAVTNVVADKAMSNNFTLSETLWSLGQLEGRYASRLPWAKVAER